MFDDDVYEAYKFLNTQNKQNCFGVSKICNGTKGAEASSSVHRFDDRLSDTSQKNDLDRQMEELKLFSTANKQENLLEDGIMNREIFQYEHKRTTNPKGWQMRQIGVHKGNHYPENIKEQGTSTDENIQSNTIPLRRKERLIDRVKHSMNRGNVSSSVSSVKITKPFIKEYEKRGILTNSTETTLAEKECVKEKIHVDYDAAKIMLLDDAMQDFNTGNDDNYLFYGRSNAKRDEDKTKIKEKYFSKKEFVKRSSNCHEMHKNPDIKTLGDSIAYFDLSYHMQELETSLEDIRKNKKKKEDHEECFKRIDKEIQKLSFKYHPDKVKNRGGTEKEITKAQELQTALNSTRTALKLLNSAFMEDIGTEHKFGFYTTLNIDSLSNEDEMRYRIYEVIFKIGVISRIKQQNIISEIRKFLIEAKSCVNNYFAKDVEAFEKHRDLALFHLKCCIKGFKKLITELDDVREQCKSDINSGNMHFIILKMAKESRRDLMLLKSLKKIAKASLKGRYQFFSPDGGVMDPYFVLPLVSYVNVILMCNVMVRDSSFFDRLNNINPELDPKFRDDLDYMMHLYYLASYCSGNKSHEATVLRFLDKIKLIEQGWKVEISKEEIEKEFYKGMEGVSDFMDCKFSIEDYNETMPTNLLMLDLKKCMKMMTEFEEKEQELTKGIKEFQKKTEKMDEKYEKFDKMMEAAEELNQKVKERLEQNKKFSEKVSNSLSDQYTK